MQLKQSKGGPWRRRGGGGGGGLLMSASVPRSLFRKPPVRCAPACSSLVTGLLAINRIFGSEKAARGHSQAASACQHSTTAAVTGTGSHDMISR